MRRTCLILGGLGAGILVILAVGVGLFAYQRIPPVAAQVEAKTNVAVIILKPAADSRFPADAAIPITVLARGAKPIDHLEFWIDGKLATTQPPQPGGNPNFVTQTWRWMPLVTGDHQITVRAHTADGEVGTSNIVHVLADPPAGVEILHTAKAEEGWDSLVSSCNTSLESIAKANPGLDTSQPVPVGKGIFIPCSPIIPNIPPLSQTSPGGGAPTSGGEAASPPVLAPAASSDKVNLWMQQNVLQAAQRPQAPVLAASLAGCSAHLVVQDRSTDELGFFVYRSGASSFERIATLGANPGSSFSYDDPTKLSAPVQYYVSAYNAAGEAESDIALVEVKPGSCELVSNPKVSLNQKFLSFPPEINLAYLYLSFDNGPWQRLPEGDQFFSHTVGSVDIQQLIAPLLIKQPQARTASLELWGWTTGGELTDLGKQTLTFDHTALEYCLYPNPGDCEGDIGSTNWTDQDGVVGSDPSVSGQPSRFFRFNANAPGLSYALVQVASVPFSDTFQATSPYLINAFLTDAYPGKGTISGQFSIDFDALSQPQAISQTTTYQPGTSLSVPAWLKPFSSLPQGAPSLFEQGFIGQMRQWGVGGMYQDLSAPVYYIRVIPWDNGKPGGKPSNTIAITYKALQKPTPTIITQQPPIYDIKVVDFKPEQRIDAQVFGCMQITSVDQNALNAYLSGQYGPFWSDLYGQAYANIYQVGNVICPPPYKMPDVEGFWSSLGDAMSGMWDEIVDLWNTVKSAVVDMVAQTIFTMTGLCDSQACHDALMAGLNYAITAYTGIPADLPTFDQLVNEGLDYGLSMAIQEAGVDCDKDCIAEIHSDFNTIKNMISQSAGQPACFSGGGGWYGKSAMCLPDGVKGEPIPGAAYKPAVVVLQATRNHVPLGLGSQYQFSASLTTQEAHPGLGDQKYRCTGTGFYNNSEGQYQQGFMNLPAPDDAQGSLYGPVSLQLPTNNDYGKQYTIPVTLVDLLKAKKGDVYIYPPFQSLTVTNYVSANNPELPGELVPVQGHLEDWVVQMCSDQFLSSPGYTITVQAQLTCADPATGAAVPCAAPADSQTTTQDTCQFTVVDAKQGQMILHPCQGGQ